MKFHSDTYLLRCLRYREKHVKDVCCCLQKCNSVVYAVVMGLISLMVISTTSILLYAEVSPLYNVLWECIVVVYTQTTLFTTILTGHCTLSHQTLLMYKISDLHLLWFLRCWDSNKRTRTTISCEYYVVLYKHVTQL